MTGLRVALRQKLADTPSRASQGVELEAASKLFLRAMLH